MTKTWYVCRKLPSGQTVPARFGDRLCFRIPFEVPPLNTPTDNVPIDRGMPFMTHSALGPREVGYLQILATIDRLAGELPDNLSRQIHESVTTNMHDFGRRLGDDMEICRHDDKE